MALRTSGRHNQNMIVAYAWDERSPKAGNLQGAYHNSFQSYLWPKLQQRQNDIE